MGLKAEPIRGKAREVAIEVAMEVAREVGGEGSRLGSKLDLSWRREIRIGGEVWPRVNGHQVQTIQLGLISESK